MADHAFLAPSAADKWAPEGGCRAQPRMAEAYPELEDSPKAQEGTAAHFYLTETLEGREPKIGDLAPNGYPVDAEMVDCARDSLDDILATRDAHPGAEFFVEQKTHMLLVDPMNWGTPDAALVSYSDKTLFVWDYKYGHGYVDAAENWQLLDYGVGLMGQRVGGPERWDGWKLILTVLQPRCYSGDGPIREWHVSGESLRATYLPRLKQSAAEALREDAPATTGPQCTYCSARHVCPALQAVGQVAMDVSRQADPVELAPPALGVELRLVELAIARLKARQTGLEEQALGIFRSGGMVPHFQASHAVGRERWTSDAAEVFALGDALGTDLRKDPEPITPGQARKALEKVGIDGTVIAAYAEKPRGGLKLSPLKENAARLAFE